jgi:phosphotransferase system, enzyme I, PtsP
VAGKPSVQVHHRGDRGVDGILRLIELAGHDGALETMLTAMCGEIAAIAGVEIASVYVSEDSRLVMRGNHGFPAAAIGATALSIGEGITGLVAECMRPVSAAHAAAETAYKHVPGLGEERYPVFVGVPLISGGSAIGVLVLQRRKRPFSSDEVTLATALGAPVMLAIERRRASAVRSARLTGTPLIGGAVLGRAAMVPTITALASRDDPGGAAKPSGAATDPPDPDALSPSELDRTLARLRDDLGRAISKLAEADAPAIGAALDRFALALCDARLRERIVASTSGTSSTASTGGSLRDVVRDYARAPYRLGTVAESAEYVAEIEELCVLLGDARTLRPGAIWIADRIGAFIAIAAVARGASALIACDAIAPAAIAVCRAGGLPAVADVAGLFSWARPGDLLAVDGDRGVVLVHPSPTDIERLRHARREL